jgi:hypothetical protein
MAAFVVAASLLTLAASDAAAWVCRAVGLGSSGYAGYSSAMQGADFVWQN